jgi:ankyrin repeat protein
MPNRFPAGRWGVHATLLASVLSLAAAAADLRLIEAARERNTEAVRALLKGRADVNATQGDGSTALHWAAHRDDVTIAELLIKAGARIDATTDTGVTPLHLACTNRSPLMVERLMQAGANPNATLERGKTALMECARTGDLRAVKALLARGADVNRKEPLHDQTALMWAISQQHPDVVEALLEVGADVHARSRAYPQTVTSERQRITGREKLSYEVFKGGSTALLFAARVGDVESARLLLRAGANVEDALADGSSALLVASYSGQQAVGQLLLDNGADPNNTVKGYTALHTAVLKGGLDLVKSLLAHGAQPNVRITKPTPIRLLSQDFELAPEVLGATPYWLAARYLDGDLLRALHAGGADPRMALKDGNTPLMTAIGLGVLGSMSRRGIRVEDGGKLAAESEIEAVVAILLEQGADINAISESGDTALHVAALEGLDLVVKRLAERGADLNLRNYKGQTPLDLATRKSTGDLLRSLGAVE